MTFIGVPNNVQSTPDISPPSLSAYGSLWREISCWKPSIYRHTR